MIWIYARDCWFPVQSTAADYIKGIEMITIDVKSNKPVVTDENNKPVTVKAVVNFIESGVEVDETCTELKITKAQVQACVEYKRLYPQVMD